MVMRVSTEDDALPRIVPAGTRMPGAADAGAAIALGAVATLAAALAFVPIGAGNDQALFVYYAQRLLAGALPYLELWDNKNPGIFGFYAGAVGVFGPGWEGVRLACAVWLGLGAAMLALLGRTAAPGTRAAWIAVALAIGLTLLRADYKRIGQVEALAPVPLAALLWLCAIEPARDGARRLRWIAAGVAVGVVAALKLVLAPVAAAVMAVALAWRLGRREFGLGDAAAAIGLSLVGFVAVWAPILAYVAASGGFAEFRWTTLDYPRRALLEVEGQKPQRLLASLKWLAVTTAAMWPAAALCLLRLRGRWRGVDGLVAAACIAWLVVGLAMIATQRFSWWDTHMDLLIWPVALLAALGIVSRPVAVRIPGAVVGSDRLRVAVGVFAALGIALHAGRLARDAATDPDWPRPRAELAALGTAREVAARADAPCGTVYAIGDQAGVERATGLAQALPTHGLWFGAFLPAQAARLPGELAAARPDLVYLDRDERADFARRQPEVGAAIDGWLSEGYREVASDALGGVWWQRRTAPGDAAACPRAARFTIPSASR